MEDQQHPIYYEDKHESAKIKNRVTESEAAEKRKQKQHDKNVEKRKRLHEEQAAQSEDNTQDTTGEGPAPERKRPRETNRYYSKREPRRSQPVQPHKVGRGHYKLQKYDFKQLAAKYPSFRQYVTENKFGNPTIDWRDPYAVRELTYVLLKHDYDLKLDIPIDQLCPPVPNRVNYIHWIADLLLESPDLAKGRIRGIDIGTGASCIYPLLGVAMHDWSFVATEVDDISLQYARKNIELNHFEHKIDLRDAKKTILDVRTQQEQETTRTEHDIHEDKQEQEQQHSTITTEESEEGAKEDFISLKTKQKQSHAHIAPENTNVLLGVIKDETFAFCMCNPPFFEDEDATGKNPKTVCMGTLNEMVTEGGEVSFVKRIIADSVILGDKIRWYTSMIGRKASLKELKQALIDLGIANIRITTFYQGKTTRWGIAWSYSQDGLRELVKAKQQQRRRQLKELCITIPTNRPADILERIKHLLTSLKLDFNMNGFHTDVNVHAPTWQTSLSEEEEEEKEGDDKEAEKHKQQQQQEQQLKRLLDMQTYLEQLAAVEEALTADPSNEELINAKAQLTEVIAMADDALTSLEEQQQQQQQEEEEEEEGAKGKREGGDEEEEEEEEEEGEKEVVLSFSIDVMQAQATMYMVEFKHKSGQEALLFEVFDYLKPRILNQ